ncbi:hypothetical protein Hanom_Chr02g00104521 [Helianthus anomalus]
MHKRLVKGFFENAIKMLSVEGEVHVTHKDEGIYKTWNIEGLAFSAGLDLHMQEKFRISEYHGYKNKYGDGQHPDDAFNLGKCKKFKFGKPKLLVSQITGSQDQPDREER